MARHDQYEGSDFEGRGSKVGLRVSIARASGLRASSVRRQAFGRKAFERWAQWHIRARLWIVWSFSRLWEPSNSPGGRDHILSKFQTRSQRRMVGAIHLFSRFAPCLRSCRPRFTRLLVCRAKGARPVAWHQASLLQAIGNQRLGRRAKCVKVTLVMLHKEAEPIESGSALDVRDVVDVKLDQKGHKGRLTIVTHKRQIRMTAEPPAAATWAEAACAEPSCVRSMDRTAGGHKRNTKARDH